MGKARSAPDASLAKSVRQQFRLSALRRPTAELKAISDRKVADEELVHELWTHREALERELKTRLKGQGTSIAAVRLARVNADAGVVAEFAFECKKRSELPLGLPAAVIAAVAAVLEYGLGARVTVSATPVGGATTGTSHAWNQIAPILAVIGTGIGVIGFVTFVGGAVVWARLKAAGFPAAPALGVIPGQDLLVIGAETLVPQILVALAVVILLTVGYVGLSLLGRLHPRTSGMLESQAQRAFAGESGVVMFFFILVALVTMLLYFASDLGFWQFVAGFILIFVLAVVAAIVGNTTRRWLYLATATFVLVGVFESYLAYSRESTDERVRGAAVIRENKKAIAGLFVAEGAGRVYLARVDDLEGDEIVVRNSRLVGIQKDQVSDVAIGDRKSIGEALDQAEALARELCDLQPQTAPPAGGQVEPCTTKAPRARPK